METKGLKNKRLKSIVWSFVVDSVEDSVRGSVRRSVYDYVQNCSVYDSVRIFVFYPVLKSTDNSVWNSVKKVVFKEVKSMIQTS
jgi:hypothetical protein